MQRFVLSIQGLRACRWMVYVPFILVVLCCPVASAWYSFGGESERSPTTVFVGVWISVSMAGFLVFFGSQSYLDFLWSKRNGIYIGPDSYRRRLEWLPAMMGTSLLLVGVGVSLRVDPVYLMVFTVVLKFAILVGWGAGERFGIGTGPMERQLHDLICGYTPDLPVFEADLSRLSRCTDFAYRVLIVKSMRVVPVLRGLENFAGVKTIRFLPSWGPRFLLASEFPWLRSILRVKTSALVLDSHANAISEVIQQWPDTEIGNWHAVLDDGTSLVRHEGTFRIVALRPERFAVYCEVVREHGPAMGFEEYYVQTGFKTSLRECAGCTRDVLDLNRVG